LKVVEFLSAGRPCVAYIPEKMSGNEPAIYVHAAVQDPPAVMKILGELPLSVIWVGGANWETDLTPWPAPSPFIKGDPYTGEAETYYEKLVEEIVPQTESILKISPSKRALAGYSLGGLFALYASYLGDEFPVIGSFSGSFWYEGLTEFMKTHRCEAEYVYMNLGRGEDGGNNPVFSKVGECTRLADMILSSSGVNTSLEWYEGTHSKMVHERIAVGIGKIALHLNNGKEK